MVVLLSLLAIVSLLGVHRYCSRQQLTPPPLRLPIIAAIGWIFYNEAIELSLFLGAGLIFLGIWITLGSGASRPQGAAVTKP